MKKFIVYLKKYQRHNFIYQNPESGKRVEVEAKKSKTNDDPYEKVTKLNEQQATQTLKDPMALKALVSSVIKSAQEKSSYDISFGVGAAGNVIEKLIGKIMNNPAALKEVADARLDPKNIPLRDLDPLFYGSLDYEVLVKIKDMSYKTKKAKDILAQLSTPAYADRMTQALAKIGFAPGAEVVWNEISGNYPVPEESEAADDIIRTVTDGAALDELSKIVQEIKPADGASPQVKNVIGNRKEYLLARILDQKQWKMK